MELTKKRLIVDAVVDGDIEVQDLEGRISLNLTREEIKVLFSILTECKKCSKYKKMTRTKDLDFLINRVEYILERIDV